MIIELDKLDHTILVEKSKNIIMLIIDPADIWKVEEKKGLKKAQISMPFGHKAGLPPAKIFANATVPFLVQSRED